MQNTPVTFKLDKSIRDKASRMKLIYNYKTYDLLFTDILDFFLDNKLSPKDASKPIHKLISETRDTLVSFQKTFESKKLMPVLYELNKSNSTIIYTFNEYIKYQTNFNNFLIENKGFSNENIQKESIEINQNIDNFNNENDLNINVKKIEELKEIFKEFDSVKKAKLIDGENKFVYDMLSFNSYMDKVRLILNKK